MFDPSPRYNILPQPVREQGQASEHWQLGSAGRPVYCSCSSTAEFEQRLAVVVVAAAAAGRLLRLVEQQQEQAREPQQL